MVVMVTVMLAMINSNNNYSHDCINSAIMFQKAQYHRSAVFDQFLQHNSNCINSAIIINSTNVLDALVLVQRSTHETACTLAQILMLTRSHSHVHVGRSASVTAYHVMNVPGSETIIWTCSKFIVWTGDETSGCLG